MIRIVLADDHQIVRQGLRALLSAEADFSVVGEASTGIEAVQLVERLRPDILVSDMMMPELNGMEVTRQCVKRSPDTRVIILSMHSNEAYVLKALQNGASGYVLKDSSVDELVQAVRDILTGERYLSPPISERMIDTYVQKTKDTTLDDPYETLTNREREIFHLVAEGYSSTEIANRLSISSRTVETHRANIMRKLNLRNQAEIIRYALTHGILPLDA
jgi:DNA-binding NarL/FixJ family response regulator